MAHRINRKLTHIFDVVCIFRLINSHSNHENPEEDLAENYENVKFY